MVEAADFDDCPEATARFAASLASENGSDPNATLGVLVDGSINQVHRIDDDNFLFDIYIMNGPEFITVTTEQLNGVSPKLNSRIRLHADGLSV